MSLICYAPNVPYKPQWAFKTPAGYRAESFVMPFSFSVLANGQQQRDYSWKLDDDSIWVFKAMVFPQVGTAQLANASNALNAEDVGTGLLGTPAMVRIRDAFGNTLTNCLPTEDLVLAVGAVGQSGFSGLNAAGFPFDCEIFCQAGSQLYFDFLLPSNAANAYLIIPNTSSGGAALVIWAAVGGGQGNAITITATGGGATSISVAGNAITITVGPSATVQDIAAALIASAAAATLVIPSVVGGSGPAMPTFGATNLVGGMAYTSQIVQGTMLGDKLFKDCA